MTKILAGLILISSLGLTACNSSSGGGGTGAPVPGSENKQDLKIDGFWDAVSKDPTKKEDPAKPEEPKDTSYENLDYTYEGFGLTEITADLNVVVQFIKKRSGEPAEFRYGHLEVDSGSKYKLVFASDIAEQAKKMFGTKESEINEALKYTPTYEIISVDGKSYLKTSWNSPGSKPIYYQKFASDEAKQKISQAKINFAKITDLKRDVLSKIIGKTLILEKVTYHNKIQEDEKKEPTETEFSTTASEMKDENEYKGKDGNTYTYPSPKKVLIVSDSLAKVNDKVEAQLDLNISKDGKSLYIMIMTNPASKDESSYSLASGILSVQDGSVILRSRSLYKKGKSASEYSTQTDFKIAQ